MNNKQLDISVSNEKFRIYLQQTAEFLELAHQTFNEFSRNIAQGTLEAGEAYADFQILRQHLVEKLSHTNFIEK